MKLNYTARVLCHQNKPIQDKHADSLKKLIIESIKELELLPLGTVIKICDNRNNDVIGQFSKRIIE